MLRSAWAYLSDLADAVMVRERAAELHDLFACIVLHGRELADLTPPGTQTRVPMRIAPTRIGARAGSTGDSRHAWRGVAWVGTGSSRFCAIKPK